MGDKRSRVCPICGKEYTDEPAICRSNNAEICTECGRIEALLWKMLGDIADDEQESEHGERNIKVIIIPENEERRHEYDCESVFAVTSTDTGKGFETNIAITGSFNPKGIGMAIGNGLARLHKSMSGDTFDDIANAIRIAYVKETEENK